MTSTGKQESSSTVFKHEPPEQFARENLKKLWRKRGLIP
jgi:hypothetical protein